MNSARERAVEAGARAMNPGAFGLDENPMVQTLAVGLAKEAASLVIRAAFPILAEELVKVAEANMHSSVMPGHVGQNIAADLRARIQQMAEAEHECL